jgi:hypothetical protein
VAVLVLPLLRHHTWLPKTFLLLFTVYTELTTLWPGLTHSSYTVGRNILLSMLVWFSRYEGPLFDMMMYLMDTTCIT